MPKIQKLELFNNSFWNSAGYKVIEENKEKSHYLIKTKNKKLELIFSVNSDSKHFPVALSSIFGKYIREKYMQGLNKLFQKYNPELPKTSGYPNKYTYEFIEKSKKIREKLNMPDKAVIRSK